MSKKIVFCADGTWNEAHGSEQVPHDTNVRKLFLSLNDDPTQLKYYDSGVGTKGSLLDRLTGGAMGEGLFQKVQDGYEFLSFTWDEGDEIFLFGFSRGAYTARSLAGMIALFGVPTRSLDNQTVARVFEAYRTTDKEKRKAQKAILTAEYGLRDVDVRMVGVWDTVGSLGVPGHLFGLLDEKKYGFLDTSLNPCIKQAFHAISLDERRASFVPTLWTNDDGTPRANDDRCTQIWFPGVHCDVGGSYAENQLSNITLRWMIDKAESCGLKFDEAQIAKCYAPMPFKPLGPAHDEWSWKWGPDKPREAPANAVLSNTVGLRSKGMPSYKPLALRGDLTKYAQVEVITPKEL